MGFIALTLIQTGFLYKNIKNEKVHVYGIKIRLGYSLCFPLGIRELFYEFEKC